METGETGIIAILTECARLNKEETLRKAKTIRESLLWCWQFGTPEEQKQAKSLLEPVDRLIRRTQAR